MAKAVVGGAASEFRKLTDCMYFISGHCKLNDKCRYRHCQAATTQTNNCFKWPKTCRNINCPYRHPSQPSKTEEKTKKPIPIPTVIHPQPTQLRQEELISFFWDIENVPIPKAQKPFDIVQRIRQKLVVESGLREYNFSCFCNSTTISQDNQLSLFHANVRIVHIPDRKSGAVDRQIMLELDRFERAHRPPATIVLISGDIDFVGKLSDLRHQAGYSVIVIHNKPAKEELKATVHAHYPWESFTQTKPPISKVDSVDSLINELTTRTSQSHRMTNQNNNGNVRRMEQSPNRATPPVKSRPNTSKKQIHQCPKCSSEFESIQALRQHQEAKDHLFDCPICDECFTTLDGQTQHQQAKNHYQAEYHCLQCNRRFNKLDGLNQHQNATGHNGYVGPALSTTDEFLRESTSSITKFPKNKQPKVNIVQDAAMVIIQQGIAALVQHYSPVSKK